MKKILVPYDFSESSQYALDYATQLASKFSSSLTLLHVAQIPVIGAEFGFISSSYPLNEKENKVGLTELATKIREDFSSIYEVNTHYEIGNPTDTITEYCNQKGFDLIVMGISGHGNQFMKITFGSTAISVSKQVMTPMLIVPPKCKFNEVHNIAYASDYDKEVERSLAIDRVKQFKNLFQANLQILHVLPEGHELNKTESTIDKFIEQKLYTDKHVTYSISDNNISDALLEFVKEHHSDMIVVEPKEHSIFHQLLLPSITNQVAFFSPVPVLII